MSLSGGTLEFQSQSTNSKVYDVVPIYPLNQVKPEKAFDYNMATGSKLYVDNIVLNGVNSSGVDYYGFNPERGYWQLVNSSGTGYTGDIAKLETNTLTDNTTLTAGSEAGTAYLKYYIDEDIYSYSNNIGTYT